MDTLLLIMILILLLYISMVYVMIQINMVSDEVDCKINKVKIVVTDYINDTHKDIRKEISYLKTHSEETVKFFEKKQQKEYDKLSNRITNLSKKSPLKEISK